MNTSQNPQFKRARSLIDAAKKMYDGLAAKRKPEEYFDFLCLVQGIPHVVCSIQEMPGDCLMLITVIEEPQEETSYIIFAPAEQVSFQIVHGKKENAQAPREIGFKPIMEEQSKDG